MSERQKKSFVDEEIKQKPQSMRLIGKRLLLAALYGLVFGGAACAVFWVTGHFGSRSALGATERAATEQTTSENGQHDTETQKVRESTEEKENSERTSKDKNKKKAEPDYEWKIEDYQAFRKKLYAVGANMKSSMVTVTGVVSEKDWFDDESEVSGQEAGIVFRKASGCYYILTDMREVQNAKQIRVSFEGGVTVKAAVSGMDSNTGLAVLSVEEKDLSDITRNLITVAKFGDSAKIKRGDAVLAVGSLQGVNYSIQDGIVTMAGVRKDMLDTSFGIMTTDIVCGELASGVLLNLNGQIIGVVRQGYGSPEQKNTLTAFSIKDLLPVMDCLIRESHVPYIGLHVSTINSVVAREHNLPEGVYVKAVATGSPAMKGGIQKGDVIISMNGKEIETSEDYQQMVFGLKKKETCELLVKRMAGGVYKEMGCEVKVSVLK